MVGAKVNGRIVQFDYHLRNGDVVEVMTSKSAHGPSRDWVKIARTSNARSKIRQWFKKEKAGREHRQRPPELRVGAEAHRRHAEGADQR